MTTPTDPLPAMLADRITGIDRFPNNGPFVRLKGELNEDGRVITVTVNPCDFNTIGDHPRTVLLHVVHLGVEQAACNGAVDPVIKTPDGNTAA